jgi:hypothetical protein
VSPCEEGCRSRSAAPFGFGFRIHQCSDYGTLIYHLTMPVSQGTTVNQSTITTSQASQTATIIRRTSRPLSPVPKAVHGITDELGVTFRIDRTSMLPTRSRETNKVTRNSISANRTPHPMLRQQPMTLITATRTPSGTAQVPQSRALADSLIPNHRYSNLANRQMTFARSTRQMQPNRSDIGPHGP